MGSAEADCPFLYTEDGSARGLLAVGTPAGGLASFRLSTWGQGNSRHPREAHRFS